MLVSEKQADAVENNVAQPQQDQSVIQVQVDESDLIRSIREHCKTHDIQAVVLYMKPKAEKPQRQRAPSLVVSERTKAGDEETRYTMVEGADFSNRRAEFGQLMKFVDTESKKDEKGVSLATLLSNFGGDARRTWLLQELRRARELKIIRYAS